MNRRILKSQQKIKTHKTTTYSQNQNQNLKDKQEQEGYLSRMAELLKKIEPNKILKMVNSIKSVNHAFEEYVNQNRLITIKYQDICKFEALLRNRKQKEKMSYKQKKEMDAIKIGFQDLKKKMEKFEVTDFISQMNYTSSIIERQLQTLSRTGYEYPGMYFVSKPFCFTEDIANSEKQSGPYLMLSPRTLEKSKVVEKASINFYQNLKND